MGKTRKKKAREKLAGRKRGKGREREPVIISLTTLFRPLLARLRYVNELGSFANFWRDYFARRVSYASQSNLKCKKVVGR